MGTEAVRTSDRVYLELMIVLTGTDAPGQEFTEETRTLVVSRRGAKILSRHTLSPQQKLRIRCLKTGHESESRVVGFIGGDEEGNHYGVEVLNAGTDFWGIDFPLLTATETVASRVLLECAGCRSQEVAHLDIFELEVLLANEHLMRPCSRCKATTVWKPPVPEDGGAATSEKTSPSFHPLEQRKYPRISLKVDACVRHAVLGEEVVVTENVSRGGFRFRSSRDYPVATVIEAALPYVPGAANIFAPARIVYREDPPGQRKIAYGAAYVPTHMASSLTGMRISRPE